MMKYERLTHRNGNRIEEYCEVGHCKYADFRVCKFKGIEHNVDEDCIPAMIERLAELEDKIEQGTLIELPCKVGDTIWGIYEFADEEDDWYEIYPVRVREIHIRKDDIWLEIQRPFIGKFVSEKICFTREEAEKRLRELQGE